MDPDKSLRSKITTHLHTILSAIIRLNLETEAMLNT